MPARVFHVALEMRIISAFITRQVLVGAGPSSSGTYLTILEVGVDYATALASDTSVLTHPQKKNTPGSATHSFTTNAGLKGNTIHIRVAGMDAPEVSLSSGLVSSQHSS